MYQLVYTKLVWFSMMNACLCEHVFDDVHDVFDELV
jgi:pentatricopeptide repeat protein